MWHDCITFYDIKNVGFPKMLVLYYIYNITHQVLYLKNNITPQDHLGGGELLYYIYNITNHLLYYIYNINPGVLYYTQHKNQHCSGDIYFGKT